MENETKKKRASKSEREEALAAFAASGMTQDAFARSRGLKTATFRSRLYASMSADRQSRRNGGFVEVAIPSAPSPVATLRFVDGTAIELPVAELERVALSLAREFARR